MYIVYLPSICVLRGEPVSLRMLKRPWRRWENRDCSFSHSPSDALAWEYVVNHTTTLVFLQKYIVKGRGESTTKKWGGQQWTTTCKCKFLNLPPLPTPHPHPHPPPQLKGTLVMALESQNNVHVLLPLVHSDSLFQWELATVVGRRLCGCDHHCLHPLWDLPQRQGQDSLSPTLHSIEYGVQGHWRGEREKYDRT